MNEGDDIFKKVEWSGDQYSPADDDLDEPPALPVLNLSPEDRELLELAARAIGCVRFEEVEGEGYANLHFADGSVIRAWNPLVHKDDAFDLMVVLGISLENTTIGCIAKGLGSERASEFDPDNPAVVTCRAITRVAAEIGKQQAVETSPK